MSVLNGKKGKIPTAHLKLRFFSLFLII